MTLNITYSLIDSFIDSFFLSFIHLRLPENMCILVVVGYNGEWKPEAGPDGDEDDA
jgi:hypothetical protein